jgi:hypothetical protein
MNENIKWFAGAVVVVGLSIGAFLFLGRKPKPVPVEAPAPALADAPPPAESQEPAVRHPVPDTERAQPLPPLASSDEPLLGAFSDLLGQESVAKFVVTQELVRHIVVTIDNLANEKVAERLRPLRPTPGRFEVGGTEDAPLLEASNYERYKPLVQLIRTTDSRRLIESYRHYYPLFQEAYESLGHPPEYFNDRLVEVIDVMLAAPEVPGPVALAQPGVLYEFADPKLEALPAGQKVLIRMGSENAAIVKAKLRELRAEIVRGPGR